MMKMTRKACSLILLPALCLAASSAVAAERLYKWVDADGNVQYSSQVPPEAAQQERTEINERGRVVKVYSAPKSAEEKAEAKRLAELEEKKRERARKRAIHDRSLLATYSNKEDMMNAQQGKISMVESLIQLTHSRIKSMQDRLVVLTEDAAGYERSGKKLPGSLQQELQTLRDQIAHNTQFAKDKETEIVEIKQQFEHDIARYEELTTDPEELEKSRKTPLELVMENPDIELDSNDRTLLTAFSSEQDLLFARNEELEALEGEISKAYEMVDKLQKQLTDLSANADEYETRGESPPHTLVSKMKGVMTGIRQGETLLREKRKQKEVAEQRYNKDIERYRYLTASN
jgi:chromosome segregation ATPase